MSCETATAVRKSWYGFLETDPISSFIHNFERIPHVGNTSPVLFADER